MNKKADFVWSKLATIILVLALLVVLLVIVYFFKDEMFDIWDELLEFLRFS